MKATILAIIFLYILLVVATKFDIEILQLNAINAFVHGNLNKMIFMKILLRYMQFNKVLKLYKALHNVYQLLLL